MSKWGKDYLLKHLKINKEIIVNASNEWKFKAFFMIKKYIKIQLHGQKLKELNYLEHPKPWLKTITGHLNKKNIKNYNSKGD